MVNLFVPLAHIGDSCKALDTQRLGKQRSEIKIMLSALTGVRFKQAQGEHGIELPENRGYQNHAATQMWRGHELVLAYAGRMTCITWMERTGRQPFPLSRITGGDTLADMCSWERWLRGNGSVFEFPEWWGDEEVHSRYRAHLLHKDPEHYAQFGWGEKPIKLEPPYLPAKYL